MSNARTNSGHKAAIRRAMYRIVSLTGIALAACPSMLHAQSIDYGSLEQLFGEPVTTSATGSPQRATEAPANMEIVTAEEIRRSGASDIPGVLRHVLGVDVMQWNSDNSDIGLRGYNQVYSPRVLVLIDGRQVYADHYGYTPWAALPVELNAIRQIEVVKGPNAALFGFNAVSGVINIITYSPLYDDVNTASVSGGTQGFGQGSAIKTLKFGDKGGLRLSASGRVDDDYSTPIPASAGTLLRNHNDHFAFDLDGVVRLSNSVQLEFEASHTGAASNDFGPVYSFAHDENLSSSVKTQLTADTDYGLVKATVYRNWISINTFNALNTKIKFDDEVTVAQFQDIYRLGTDHTLRLSLEYRHSSVNTTPFVGGHVFYDVYSAGGMWNWNITPSLSLTNAVRFDSLRLGRDGATPAGYPFVNSDWNRSLGEWSYNSGLVWKVDDPDTLRLLVSRGDQLPSLANFGAFVIASPAVNTTGNPNIDPTDVMNYEIDWDRALPIFGAKFRTAVFYEKFADLISLTGGSFGGAPAYTGMANAGSSAGRGMEVSLKGTFLTHWRWGANYRFEYISDQFEPFARDGKAYLDFEHVTPRHVAKANLGWADDRWEVDGFLGYQSATQGLAGLPFSSGSFLTPVPDYVSVDARLAYKPTEWATLSISGQNLLQSPQQQTSGPEVERRVFATLSVNY